MTLRGGTFVDEEGNTVRGTLAWKNPGAIPAIDATTATWVFTPTNDEYAVLEGNVAITVKKLAAAPGMPATTMRVPFETVYLGEVPLNENWAWVDDSIELTPNVTTRAVAEYIGADRENYEKISVTISVLRAACKHYDETDDGICENCGEAYITYYDITVLYSDGGYAYADRYSAPRGTKITLTAEQDSDYR